MLKSFFDKIKKNGYAKDIYIVNRSILCCDHLQHQHTGISIKRMTTMTLTI